MFNINFQKLKSTLPRPNSSTPNSNRQPSLSFKRWENLILFLKLFFFFRFRMVGNKGGCTVHWFRKGLRIHDNAGHSSSYEGLKV